MGVLHHPVAIIGAGPIGLAIAGYLHACGLSALIFESGPAVAHNIRQWAHVRLFSPWSMNPDSQATRKLADAGLYIAGIKSDVRAGTFLLQTGYRQAASIAAALANPADQAEGNEKTSMTG